MTISTRVIAMTGAALLVTACNNDEPTPPPANDMATQASMGTTPGDTNMMVAAPVDAVAFGLTEQQLLDADFKDWRGDDLGDVEALERDTGGTVTHLIVEIEETDPDRYVRVPVDGLQRVADGDDWDVRGQYTHDQLMALPQIPAQPGW
ncbi:PRC-barrel domain containing protein [Sphingomonas sp. AX6]|uniref:PRC-barrel domain containing protein n=1 Tax=Sphingomonas sp. AX6 TaxID=2653171 RepID=UPI0012F191FC|nr:PRC-barrel domain containing protein [Sphingomonas sp. AX6]VXC87475.1 conserved exported hypothetical protein [Sphingomonas sp. AX6]